MVKRIPLMLAFVAAVVLAAAGAGVRLELWSYRTGFELLRWAFYLGIAAAALAIILFFVPKARAGGFAPLLAGLAIGGMIAAVPFGLQRNVRSVPAIHDITTDVERPPQFVAVVALRKQAPNPVAYDGAETAKLQRAAYPDIQPLMLTLPPAAAFAKARAAAEAMRWDIVALDEKDGRIEATATTFWFGFKDDIVVRVAATGAGSRIDVRSKSRVGRSDAGTNAKRVRQYLSRLQAPE